MGKGEDSVPCVTERGNRYSAGAESANKRWIWATQTRSAIPQRRANWCLSPTDLLPVVPSTMRGPVSVAF